MVVFTSILSKIALLALFFGVLSSISLDILGVIAHPLSLESWKTLVVNSAKTVTNSQNTIARSVDEFKEGDEAYKSYVVWRIIGCSLITAIFVWGVYKGLRKVVRTAELDLGTQLLVIVAAFVIVWLIGLVASILSGEGVPTFIGFYNGWIQLILKREVFIEYIVQQISKGEFIP